MINILLTSVGAVAGDFIVRHLRSFKDYRLIGLDVDDEVACYSILNSFYRTSKTISEEFKLELVHICNIENIDVIIPISSHDIDFFSQNPISKFDFRKIPKTLVMDEENHALINDKLLAYNFCNDIGVITPKVYREDSLTFPSIYKPRKASGSKGVVVLENLEDLYYHLNKNYDGFISEYIEGDEYTCDTLFNFEGKCIGHLVRVRNKVRCGAATVSTTIKIDVQTIIHKLENSKIFRGPVNFQFKVKNQKIIVFDLNDRFASGGLPLSVEVGFDIPKLLIDLLYGIEPKSYFSYNHINEKKMIKFFTETYINE
jgi:carbamoyl-phosphate synthase large subunit